MCKISKNINIVKHFNVKDVIDEDFVNYKKPSMFIATSKCSFKCEKEDCEVHCQNSSIVRQKTIKENINKLINRYLKNDITHAIVFGGLEPFDQMDELISFIIAFRKYLYDDIVIYTGYNEIEVYDKRKALVFANNHNGKIIIKYGRFKANGIKRYDNILGIELASSNQYAVVYN